VFVRDFMSSPAVSVTPDTPCPSALKLMHKHRFRRLPVVNQKGELLGLISERALLYVASAPDSSLRVWECIYLISKLQERGVVTSGLIKATPERLVTELARLLSRIRIRELLTTEPVSVTANAPIEAAARLMLERQLEGLPVVDEDDCVVGIITKTDVVRVLLDVRAAGDADVGQRLEIPAQTCRPMVTLEDPQA
jgi:acetoin utilization protein AcuB